MSHWQCALTLDEERRVAGGSALQGVMRWFVR